MMPTPTQHTVALHDDLHNARKDLALATDNAHVRTMTVVAQIARAGGQPNLLIEGHLKGIEVLTTLVAQPKR